jgi:hypothetical protein
MSSTTRFTAGTSFTIRLEIRDAELANRLAGYVDEVRARYPALTPTRSSTEAST